MYLITARNVHVALPKGLAYIRKKGIPMDSRNGQVLVAPSPVVTHYHRPLERVMFWEARDANPFFHFFESLWMLAGRNDIAYLTQFVKRFIEFSDDGVTQHGAYGHRWLHHFDMEGGGHNNLPDQLSIIIDRLKKFPQDRRCVLTMWDPVADLGAESKDLPCNVNAFFGLNHHGHLNMEVNCRSNDMIWGAYGANAVHFSVLQEYIASSIGVKVGPYWQNSFNFHAYLNTLVPLEEKFVFAKTEASFKEHNPYNFGAETYPLFASGIGGNAKLIWDADLKRFMDMGYNHSLGFNNRFFSRVACPLMAAHDAYKAKEWKTAYRLVEQCWAKDWQLACKEWLRRRERTYQRAADDGPNYEGGE